MAHGILSPSGWNTWGHCPGSVWLSKDLPESTSPYAEEGTKAHELACALGLNKAGKAPDPDLSGYDDEMIRCARAWARLTNGYINADSGAVRFAYEDPVDLETVTGEKAHGTVDFWCLQKSGRLVVCDFKYGMGVQVPSDHNGQLSIYAAALLSRLNAVGAGLAAPATSVEIVIFQPRINSEPSIWSPANREFNDFIFGVVKPAAALAMDQLEKSRLPPVPGERWTTQAEDGYRYAPKLIPGEAQCHFCKAKAVCPALAAKVSEEIGRDFDVIAPPEPLKPASQEGEPPEEKAIKVPADAEHLARVLPWLETIEDWCDACRAAARSRLEQGEELPGWKLVAGRKGARKWLPEAEGTLNAMRISKAVLYEKKLISPAKAEKAAKAGVIGSRQWNSMQRLITQEEGRPVIAPASDPRPAILASIADDFDVIESEPVKELPSPAAAQQENMSEEAEDPFDFI